MWPLLFGLRTLAGRRSGSRVAAARARKPGIWSLKASSQSCRAPGRPPACSPIAALQHRHPGVLIRQIARQIDLVRRLHIEERFGLFAHGDLRDLERIDELVGLANWKRVGVTSPSKVPSLLRFICMVSIFMTVKSHFFCT